MTSRKSDSPVVSHPPEAVLEIKHVAEWLRMGVRSVEKLDIPCVFLGTRSKRYIGKDVLDYLEKRKTA